MNYYEYIKSSKWADRRMRHLRREGCNVCWNCGESKGWKEVHHITYERLGVEADADLVTLCKPCHEIVHAIEDSGTPLNQCHVVLKGYNVAASLPTTTSGKSLAAKCREWQIDIVAAAGTLTGPAKAHARECWKALAILARSC